MSRRVLPGIVLGLLQASAMAAGQAVTTTVMLQATVTQAAPNQAIHFTLSASAKNYAYMMAAPTRFSYRFDWGDGTTTQSAQTQADHAYAAAGTYRVSATVLANTYKPATVAQSNEVTVTIGQQPSKASKPRRVTLGAKPTEIRPGGKVAFAAAVEAPPADAQYEFDFGDGPPTQAQSDQRIEHVYTSAGSYAATVTMLTNDETQAQTSPPVTITVAVPQPVEPGPVNPGGTGQTFQPQHWYGSPSALLLLGAAVLLLGAGVVAARSLIPRHSPFSYAAVADAGWHGMRATRPQRTLFTLVPGMGPVNHEMRHSGTDGRGERRRSGYES